MILMALSLLYSFSNCPQAHVSGLRDNSIKARLEQERSLYLERRNYTRKLAGQYLIGYTLTPKQRTCLRVTREVSQAFTNAVLMQSLEHFATSRSRLLRVLTQEFIDSEIPYIRLASQEYHLMGRKAEVIRTTGIINTDILSIHYNEWPTILFHEITHRLDKQLKESTIKFGNPTNIERLQSVLENNDNWIELNSEDQDFILFYLENGIHRGFLAEFRSWALSVMVYKALISEGKILPIAWMEEMIEGGGDNLVDQVYWYLRPRFRDPNWLGIFSSEIIKEAYNIKMAELDQSNKLNIIKKAFPNLDL